MPVRDVLDIEKKKVSEIQLSDSVFNIPVHEAAIFETIRMQRASMRRGTSLTKGRSDIRGGGRKPWRQKGTGRARAGSIRSPLWRGGGVVFGPQPRDYSFRIPKKVRRLALRSALSQKLQGDRLVILSDFPMGEIKTKQFKDVMVRFGWTKTLFVLDRERPILEKSSRNLQGIKMIRSEGINVYDLMNHEYVVFLEPSVKQVEGALLS